MGKYADKGIQSSLAKGIQSSLASAMNEVDSLFRSQGIVNYPTSITSETQLFILGELEWHKG